RLRGSSPAVMEHLHGCGARADLPKAGAHAESLRVLVRVDVAAEPDTANFSSVPLAIRRDAVEAAVEVQIVDEQSFDPLVPVALRHGFLQDLRATVLQDFIG